VDFSFPARFSNTPKFRIFRSSRLFPYPFYQLQIFYIEAFCCALELERITPSLSTRHQSYSPKSSSSFILPLFTTSKKHKKHIFAPDYTIAPPHSYVALFLLQIPILILTEYTTAIPILSHKIVIHKTLKLYGAPGELFGCSF